MFKTRSLKPERIDTGDYTPAEYAIFLKEIKLINRLTGDMRALRKSLFAEIERRSLRQFSVLDVGAGSGEMLREVARFADRTGRKAQIVGLDLNEVSARSIFSGGAAAVRGDALKLPFEDGAFDFAICSLFTHHLGDEEIVAVLREMSRVSRLGIFVIDLHRHRMAYALYQLFCFAFRISPLVREDGSLSILRGFKPRELEELGQRAGLEDMSVERCLVYRLIIRGK